MVGSVLMDVRMAVRSLLRDRGVTVVVVVTLALAIGANTAIFTVVEGVLLRPLPYPHADRLVRVSNGLLPAPGRAATLPFSDRGYWHFVDHNRVFDSMGGYIGAIQHLTLTGAGEPLPVDVAVMSRSAFETLGVQPELGRIPAEEEEQPPQPGYPNHLVVLLSHSLWVSRFGSDPGIVGRNVQLDTFGWEVIGVMPEGYDFPTPGIDIWTALQLDPTSTNYRAHDIEVIARLAPGATTADAVADAERLIAGYGEVGYPPSWFDDEFSGTAVVTRLQDEIVGDVRHPLLILLGAVALLFIVACGNVANLSLVRAAAQARESGIRLALGASRSRLIRYALTEGLLLGLTGGAAGILLAHWATDALLWASPESIPRLDDIGIRLPVILYAAGLSFLAGILFSLSPALRSGSSKTLGVLSVRGRGSTLGVRWYRARGLLVVAQVTLAFLVVVGSGLMVRSFLGLRGVDLGFVPEGLLTFELQAPVMDYGTPERRAQFFARITEGLEDLPGVVSAGGVTVLPLGGVPPTRTTVVDEFPPRDDELAPSYTTLRVTPGYFETMGIPVSEGRSFTSDDHTARLGSVIMSESLKDVYWPDVSGLNKRLTIRTPVSSVGVVGDVHVLGAGSPAEPTLYLPMLDSVGGDVRDMTMIVRAEAAPLSLVPAIRKKMADMQPDVAIKNVRPMDDVVSDSMSRTTYTMSLLLLAAVIAVLLASAGLYGLISYVVGRRTSEIGLRLAIGADTKRVRRMILWQGVRLGGAGVAIGLLVSLPMWRLFASLLYDVEPFDLPTISSAVGLLLGVAMLAAYVPALRGSRVPPAEALAST